MRLIFQRNAEGFIDRLSLSVLMLMTLYRRPKKQTIRFRANALIGLLAGIVISVLCLVFCRRKKRRA